MTRLLWWTIVVFEVAAVVAGCARPVSRPTSPPPPAVPTDRPAGPPAPEVRLTQTWPSCTQLRREVGHPSLGHWQRPPNLLMRFSRDQVARHPTAFLFATGQGAPGQPWQAVDIVCTPRDDITTVIFRHQ